MSEPAPRWGETNGAVLYAVWAAWSALSTPAGVHSVRFAALAGLGAIFGWAWQGTRSVPPRPQPQADHPSRRL